jgi:hypothetical protein
VGVGVGRAAWAGMVKILGPESRQSSYKGRCILISSTDYSIGVPQYCNTVTFP